MELFLNWLGITPIWTVSVDHVLLHFVVWCLVVIVFSGLAYYEFPISRPIAYLVVSSLVLIAGFAKEMTDLDGFNLAELYTDMVGILFGIALFLMLVKRCPWGIRKQK